MHSKNWGHLRVKSLLIVLFKEHELLQTFSPFLWFKFMGSVGKQSDI